MFRQVYFGRLVRFPLSAMRACISLEPQTGEEGESRQLITMFDVKKRVFHGNTSMEAEISLLMANQAQVSGDVFKADIANFTIILQAVPGKLIYDPFAGTGSMLYVRQSVHTH